LKHNLSSAYSHTGDFEKAYELIREYSISRDSLYKKEKTKTLSAWMNARTAEQDKAIVSQQLHITQQEDQLRRKNIWIGGSLLILLILASVSVPVINNYRQKQIIQQSVISELKHKQEIDELKAQVRGEEQERQRIAQELHDNIASQLLSINQTMQYMQYNATDGTAYDNNIAEVFHRLTDVTQDVRKTAHSLMPDLLLEEGLSTALASVCGKIKGSTDLEVDFQEYGMVPIIDKDIELSIYRMVQELVQNVLKHAKDASYLLVQLSCVDTLLSITVEDNGTQFKNGADGAGLQQVRERVKALKGHFDLHHSPDKGTTAYLEFDLQHFL
jgi:signal transduction histidine kinase